MIMGDKIRCNVQSSLLTADLGSRYYIHNNMIHVSIDNNKNNNNNNSNNRTLFNEGKEH